MSSSHGKESLAGSASLRRAQELLSAARKICQELEHDVHTSLKSLAVVEQKPGEEDRATIPCAGEQEESVAERHAKLALNADAGTQLLFIRCVGSECL